MSVPNLLVSFTGFTVQTVTKVDPAAAGGAVIAAPVTDVAHLTVRPVTLAPRSAVVQVPDVPVALMGLQATPVTAMRSSSGHASEEDGGDAPRPPFVATPVLRPLTPAVRSAGARVRLEGPTVPTAFAPANEVVPAASVQSRPIQTAAFLDDLKRADVLLLGRLVAVIHPIAPVTTGSVP